jgi:hypothetical protein
VVGWAGLGDVACYCGGVKGFVGLGCCKRKRDGRAWESEGRGGKRGKGGSGLKRWIDTIILSGLNALDGLWSKRVLLIEAEMW